MIGLRQKADNNENNHQEKGICVNYYTELDY